MARVEAGSSGYCSDSQERQWALDWGVGGRECNLEMLWLYRKSIADRIADKGESGLAVIVLT